MDIASTGTAVERTPFDTYIGWKGGPEVGESSSLVPTGLGERPKETCRRKIHSDIDSDSLFEMPFKRV